MIQHRRSAETPHEHPSPPCDTSRIWFSVGWLALCLTVVLASCGTTPSNTMQTRAAQAPKERLNSKVVTQLAQLFDRHPAYATR